MVSVRYAVLALLLVACSDGDDTGTGPPPGGNSFAVTTVAPAEGATDVEINASISASFSEAVAPSTLNAESFTLKTGGNTVPAAVVYEDGSRLARLTAPLLPGTTYEATVTTAVQAGDGTLLGAPKEWTFNTRAWSSVTIDTAGGFPSGPSLILDASGTLHLGFGSLPDIRYATCSASCSLSASWRSVTIGQGEFPSLAIDGNGRRHLTYVGSGKATYATCAASCLESSNWDVVALDDGSTQGPSIKADDDGRLHVSYFNGVSGDIKYATCASACATRSQWETVVVAHAVAGPVTSLAVEPSGRVHLTFDDIGEMASRTHLAYATCASDCTMGANWDWIDIDNGDRTGAISSLVVDAKGRLHVAYTSGGDYQIHYATCAADCTTAANWQIVGIPTVLGGNASSLAVDQTGRLHISYTQYINFSDSELRYATCAAGCTDIANWQTALLYPDRVSIRGTSILVDGTGRVRLSHATLLAVYYEE